MTVDEVVKFVDQMVFEKTGKHLDDIQIAVVEGTWNKKSYDDIARKYNLTTNHIADIGSKLWQLLSDILNQDIKKSNFCSTIKRIYIQSSQNPNICIGNSHCFNFSSQLLNNPSQPEKTGDINSKYKLSAYDLTFAPEIINFYRREKELEKLSDWIFNQNTRLISVLGLYGVGKTTLVKRFLDFNLNNFPVVIWRSLKYPQSLDLLVSDILNVCQQQPEETLDKRLKQLFYILCNHKCLIVLDDFQNIFIPGKFAGQYKSEYQDYQNFLTMITEFKHQSHVIVISQEQCPEMKSLEQEFYPIKCLQLSGLYDVDILGNTDLQYQESWLKLINLYAGNFNDLKSVISLIHNNYDGDVCEFLSDDTLLITNQMQSRFREIYNRLSTQEKDIVLSLINFGIPVSREDLKLHLSLSVIDFNNALQSLQQRYLVTKIKNEKILFQLYPVFRGCLSSQEKLK
ncbi:NB-ARC domain-containing protein [Anabaenopsis elenkinii]|uniref:ATPase n=1 Tax=Anabaenopsis elenkinii CCIBt3563 TaxID=2779889 RepID=A0A7S6U5P1_9CYAN|nr:NB-ARC domain-containing protein [Anabaenopsis elenkinii]QOV22874.1 ATPase [Anabaenopsis elenkinii CCIBt3563]